MPYFGIPIRNGLPIGLGSVAALSAVQLFSPSSLFAGGVEGTWYDPSDRTTLFQDSAGTQPVTAVEQPVGLMLDKSKGLVLGPELVTNGDFSSGTTGWTAGSGGAIAADTTIFASGIKVTGGGIETTAGAQQVLSGLVVGRSYRVSTSAYAAPGNSTPNSATISLKAAPLVSDSSVSAQVSASGVIQTLSFVFTATATSHTIYGFVLNRNVAWGSTDSFAYFDNISVRELPGNHAFQATSTSRPILRQDASGRYYLSFDGTDDWLQTNSINFTATDNMTVFAGVRKLSDAAESLIAELSANLETNNGTFNLYAPGGISVARDSAYVAVSKGTTKAFCGPVAAAYAAPVSNVVTELFSISGPSAIIRVNGVQAATSTATQGTGNYGNYPLYIGRRGGTTLPFNGRIYGLVIRGAASTTSQIQQTEAWLNQRTGAF